MRRQIQLLQETVKVQQALLEENQRRFDDDGFGRDSSSSRSSRLHQCQPRMKHIKVDIPDFEGELQPNEFVDWLQAIERVFEYKEIPEEHKVKIVALKLKKHALIWWENLKRRRKREGKSKIKTWEKMRQKLSRYGHIALDCPNRKSITMINAEVHEIFEEEKEDTHESFEDETMGEPIYDEEYASADICEAFEEEGYIDPIYDDEYGSDDIHEVFEKEDKDESIYDEEYVLAEYGESLEVKRSLQTTTSKEGLWLANNGRCEHVASNYIEEELKFPMINHPDPYKLQWLNMDNEVKVSQHSIISFSIDKNYKENLWCNVIPMDPCHIHLGRPWKYNRHALFDGYANIYTFVKVEIKTKLARLPLNQFNEGKDGCKSLELSHTKEPFKDKTKLCLLRPVPKPPWENVGSYFVLGILWTLQQKYSEILTRG
ncbi:Gag-Pol polyprotein/retrotransposon, putative [Medicago truncatula]|uniref:Gag-Pol polyprotein/retrotransposon, putative n=1 Tax=Medicago truncatula TaxID=3880 RepID=A0A072U9W7_MEDTR|nr:Gag-Pol polyprotein/retrotransposon, putative [Medicago truncatula]